MSKLGDTKQEKLGDVTEVWKLIKIISKEDEKVHRNRIKIMEKELETIEEFDEEMVAQSAINEERKERQFRKEDTKAQIKKLKELVGDE